MGAKTIIDRDAIAIMEVLAVKNLITTRELAAELDMSTLRVAIALGKLKKLRMVKLASKSQRDE